MLGSVAIGLQESVLMRSIAEVWAFPPKDTSAVRSNGSATRAHDTSTQRPTMMPPLYDPRKRDEASMLTQTWRALPRSAWLAGNPALSLDFVRVTHAGGWPQVR